MSTLIRARAGAFATARRPLLQSAPSLASARHGFLNSTITTIKPTSPTQLLTIRRTFGNKRYVSRTDLDDDLDAPPAKPKAKGRWVFAFLFMANLSMFAVIHRCRTHLKRTSKKDEETRVAEAMAELEAKGYEMTPERARIVRKWDTEGIALCHRVLANCATSLDKFRNEDYTSFFLAPISHMDASHLAVNMISFFFLGRAWLAAHPTVGFARIAIGAAAAGNFGQYASSYLHGHTDQRGLGASGMTSGIAGALLTTVPLRNIYDLALMVGIQWALDGYRIVNPQSGDRIGHGAHLGGAAFGVLYGLLLRRRLR